MAKRKQNQPAINADAVRWVAIGVVVLVAVFLAFQALSSFLRHARLFIVKDISVVEGLGELKLPELEKMKGNNIFSVKLTEIEAKVIAKYPQIGGLKVLRRLPDQIMVTGFRRDPVVIGAMNGRSLVISNDNFFMGSPTAETEKFPRVKGLKATKAAVGAVVEDVEGLELAIAVVNVVKKDGILAAMPFWGVDVSDVTRIICIFGEGKDSFEVQLDKAKFPAQLKILSTIVGRTGLDLAEVKYIDLRFGEPLIGKKKVKK